MLLPAFPWTAVFTFLVVPLSTCSGLHSTRSSDLDCGDASCQGGVSPDVNIAESHLLRRTSQSLLYRNQLSKRQNLRGMYISYKCKGATYTMAHLEIVLQAMTVNMGLKNSFKNEYPKEHMGFPCDNRICFKYPVVDNGDFYRPVIKKFYLMFWNENGEFLGIYERFKNGLKICQRVVELDRELIRQGLLDPSNRVSEASSGGAKYKSGLRPKSVRFA